MNHAYLSKNKIIEKRKTERNSNKPVRTKSTFKSFLNQNYSYSNDKFDSIDCWNRLNPIGWRRINGTVLPGIWKRNESIKHTIKHTIFIWFHWFELFNSRAAQMNQMNTGTRYITLDITYYTPIVHAHLFISGRRYNFMENSNNILNILVLPFKTKLSVDKFGMVYIISFISFQNSIKPSL